MSFLNKLNRDSNLGNHKENILKNILPSYRKLKKFREKELKKSESTGVILDQYPKQETNGRFYTLLTNALINFMICIGALGCFVKAFDINCSMFVCIAAGALIALIFSFMYFNKLTKMAGYLLMFAIFLDVIINMRYVAKGGFGFVCNKLMVFFQDNLLLPIENEYKTYGQNEYFSSTVAFIFILFAVMFMFNMAISESKGFVVAFLFSFPVVQLGMYFDLKTNIPYFTLYFAGLVALIIFRSSPKHYKMESKKHNGYSRKEKKKKKKIVYDYAVDGRYNAYFLSTIFVMAAVFALIISIILPQSNFNMTTKFDKYKNNTRDFTTKLITVGFYGMLGDGISAGGTGRGKLGQTKKITLDFETDLKVRFTPEEDEAGMYIKAYNGTYFRNSQWQYIKENDDVKISLKKYGLSNDDFNVIYRNLYLNCHYFRSYFGYAKNYEIDNVDATQMFEYSPYIEVVNTSKTKEYTYDDSYVGKLKKGWITYGCYSPITESTYQRLEYFQDVSEDQEEEYNDAKEEGDEDTVEAIDTIRKYDEYVNDVYMDVPEVNEKTIKKFCEKYDLEYDGTNMIELVQKISDAFEQDYTYTLLPGTTPKNKDFVNYFLNDSKKGYCVYFATATTLILRYLGVPARYAAGYALGSDDFNGGEPITDEEVLEEWLDGGELDTDTYIYGLREYEVEDADAHAWVEVYVNGLGWIPVDTTPSSDEDIEDEYSMTIQAGDLNNLPTNSLITQKGLKTAANTVIAIVKTLFTLLVIAIVVYIVLMQVLRQMRRRTRSINKKLKYLYKCTGFIKLEKRADMPYENYAYMLEFNRLVKKEDIYKIMEIVERIKFSDSTSVSSQEEEFVSKTVNAISDEILRQLGLAYKIIYIIIFGL